MLKRVLCAILVVFVAGCGVPYMRDSKSETVAIVDNPNLVMQVRERVKSVLKSPASAQFSNERLLVNKEKRQTIITGTVDSQNSFGAMLRGTYECVFVQNDDGTQTSRGLYFDRDGMIQAAF